MKITVSTSQKFHNKDGSDFKNFAASELTPDELAQHITSGKAWTPAVFEDGIRDKEHFQSAQCVALDCDDDTSVADALADDAVRRFAFLVHPSPSSTDEHPRTRIIFILDQEVDHRERYETLLRALIHRFEALRPDRTVKDAARFYYGSDLPGAHVNTDAVLPLKALAAYTVFEAADEDTTRTLDATRTDAPALPVMPESERSAYAEAAYNAELDELRSTRVHRHTATFAASCALFGMVKGGWPGITETAVIRDLTDAAMATGLEDDIERQIERGREMATPRPYPLLTAPVHTNGHTPEAAVSEPPSAIIITGKESMAQVERGMWSANVVDGEPLPWPLDTFHHLEGLCRVIMPRKTIGIIAPSSHGKTAFLETLVDRWLQMGLHGFWYGPEWSPLEMGWRRIQRYGGPTYTELMEWELFKKDRARGATQPRGKELSPHEINKVLTWTEKIKEWPGDVDYINKSMALPDLNVVLTDLLARRRKEGRAVAFAVFDYAQLLKVPADEVDDGNRQEAAVEMVKEWCGQNDIVGVIGSQTTKMASGENKRRNRSLESEDAMFIRDFTFNLLITLNIHTELDPRDEETIIYTDRADAKVTKNSGGLRGKVEMKTDFRHLTWRQVDRYSKRTMVS